MAGYLDDLPSLTPIRGTVSAKTNGDALNSKGSLHTIVSPICERYLLKFNHLIHSKSKELIKIRELSQLNEFDEYLHPQSSFDPAKWTSEQSKQIDPQSSELKKILKQ